LKPSAEQQFLYGHHVLKSGLGRITENTPKYQGVIILSMNDMPLVSESKTHSTVNGVLYFVSSLYIFKSEEVLRNNHHHCQASEVVPYVFSDYTGMVQSSFW